MARTLSLDPRTPELLAGWSACGSGLKRSTWAPPHPGHLPPLQPEAHIDGRRLVLRGGCRLALHVQPGSYNTETLSGAAARLRAGAEPGRGAVANLKGKGGELANLAGDTLNQVIVAATQGADRVRQTPHLPHSFLRRCDLSLL
ncbi:MAG TPA: hypothetical protein VFL71_08985 [Actinomycetes bacterium]|nr:hypothetical protein [Actinomycetes bacterium]